MKGDGPRLTVEEMLSCARGARAAALLRAARSRERGSYEARARTVAAARRRAPTVRATRPTAKLRTMRALHRSSRRMAVLARHAYAGDKGYRELATAVLGKTTLDRAASTSLAREYGRLISASDVAPKARSQEVINGVTGTRPDTDSD